MDLPACLAAPPADFAAEVTPPVAERAEDVAFPSLPAASLRCLVEADFLPLVCDFAFAWLRFLVAAPFFAAACRSAFV
jgi:hypothetical protein